ncbi:SusC/RagA family TonB-linked outer membrane protein [Paludibacter sp.]|uniref:SusC/RagA family TonB-linked outer membrane protein n=1 Tax=Paludibacter sp. TaxID=1898105 RepID=UPI0013525480|nr:SusC/RagA family TonB-linked outer membrane protein [Paludibacter sp.]MTK51982.1 SusC/RagA family TonB-linked outer membrane protein [Paludibacter sp.]
MRKAITLLCLLIGMSWASAQTKITGTVVSADDGQPVIGATVLVKGTSTGTITDPNGQFSINLPSNGKKLVVSYVGMSSTEIDAKNNVKVVLQTDTKQIKEVVVTALGIKRDQRSLGYAATQIGGNSVNEVKDANFINSLSGKVAGVSIQASNAIGGSSNVILRGFKSITGNNQALFVVDGVPIDNSNNSGAATSGSAGSTAQATGRGGYDFGNAASDINPDDIESISILKGAAASALYGSRAANGVVMITTKKGSQKNKDCTSKGSVFYNVSYNGGLVNPQTLPKYQKEYGAGYGIWDGSTPPSGYTLPASINGRDMNSAEAVDNGAGFFNYGTGPLANGKLGPYVPYEDDASFGAPFNSNLMVYNWDAWVPGSPNYGKMTPWVFPKHSVESYFQLSNTINNNVGFEGGNQYGSFRLSYTNMYQTGYMPNNNLKKNTVNASGSYEIKPGLTASALFNYVSTSSYGNTLSGYNNNVMTNFREWNQTNVDIRELKDIYFATRKNYGWNLSSYDPSATTYNQVPIFWDNPYYLAYENAPKMGEDRFFGNFALTYKFTDWLTGMARVGYDIYSQLMETHRSIGSNTGGGQPYFSRFNNNFSEINYDAYLTATKRWGKFDINAVLGTNVRVNNQNSIYAVTNGGLLYPGFYSLTNSANTLLPPVEKMSKRMVYGYYLTASLGWDSFLYLDLGGRADKSSTLPVDNNFYFYPSVSGSFVFSKFLTDKAPWLSFGKLRLNFAEVGNDAPFSILQNYYTPNISSSGQPTDNNPLFGNVGMQSTFTSNMNSHLKQENTQSVEAGLEMQLFQNRIGLDVAYYLSNTYNQILPLSVSSSTGYFYNYINSGQIRNQGIELGIKATPVKTNNFSWNTSLNWYKNWNKVVALYTDASGKPVTNYQVATFQQGVSLNATVGRPYGDLYGTDYTYAPDGQKVVNSSGYYVINKSSNNIIGNIQPKYKGGWSNTLTYKNLSLSFLIDCQIGGSVYSLDMAYGIATGLYPETAGNNDLGNPVRNSLSTGGGLILPGVVKQADGSYVANTTRIDAGAYSDGLYVEGYYRSPNKTAVYDASYVKLRELSISYNVPKRFVEKTKIIKDCSVALTGKNLWIIYKNLPYSDPETIISSGNIQGFQVGALPSLMQFGAKLNLTF